MADGLRISSPVEIAAELAWRRYDSTCRLGGTTDERRWAYHRAREAQQRVWELEGRPGSQGARVRLLSAVTVFFAGQALGLMIGRQLEREAALRRQRDELRRRCQALAGSTVTTSDDGGVW